MEHSKAIVVAASSPSETPALPPPESDSLLSNLICDVSQQVQTGMENMLKLIQEIDQSSSGIMEEIEKCKESVMEKRKVLEGEKESFQKAAYTVLEMLNNR